MRSKPCLELSFALFFLCAASPVLAQAIPSATETEPPLAVGAGVSGYNPDFGHSHLLGGTLWIDYSLSRTPYLPHGIGLEIAARDLNYDRSSSQPDLREDVAEAGVIYSWHRFRNLRPYGKILMGYGNTDYGSTRAHEHDSRTIASMGGGVEFRAARCVWVRADYEYQFWPDFFKHPVTHQPAGELNPQGFTVGVLYHFSLLRFRLP
jgi:opacity protein-like surface antigen